MDSGARTDELALAAAEEMFAERGSCCIWVPWSGSQAWERIRPPATDGGRPSSTGRRWWTHGLKALMKVREWSEIVAGPRWKTFIRRFRRRPRYGGERSGGRFGYDPLSYARNFDDGQGGDSDGDISWRGFSARYATLPASAKSSMDLGGHDAPPFVVDDGGEGMRFV